MAMAAVSRGSGGAPAEEGGASSGGDGGTTHASIGGAKAKLDELFLTWLALPDTSQLFDELMGQIREGKPLETPPHTSLVASLLVKSSGAVASPTSPSPSSLRSKNSPPPRSPSRPVSPSKHFTFDGVWLRVAPCGCRVCGCDMVVVV